MNALRALLAHMARAHVALAERMTPAAFARVWTGVAVGALVGSVAAPDPATGFALAVIGGVATVMAWLNASGRIHP